MTEREGEREKTRGEGEREERGKVNSRFWHVCTRTYNSNDSEKHNDSKCKEGDECVGLDVGVPILIHLHQNYPASDEHEGSVYTYKFYQGDKYSSSSIKRRGY